MGTPQHYEQQTQQGHIVTPQKQQQTSPEFEVQIIRMIGQVSEVMKAMEKRVVAIDRRVSSGPVPHTATNNTPLETPIPLADVDQLVALENELESSYDKFATLVGYIPSPHPIDTSDLIYCSFS